MSILSRLFGKREPRTVSTEPAPMVRAGYDAARSGNETLNLWTQANALDADACNSLAVRKKLRESTRDERGSNGQCSGIISTHTNYIVGTGPKLRMLTKSRTFNQMVETRWKAWCKATKFAKKLRTMSLAKTTDGETFAIMIDNPRINDPVKLDIKTIECDQVTAPTMKSDDENYVDGITFDKYGNPISYDILKRHPGAAWYQAAAVPEFDVYPASHVIHWFNESRPGQHRGVPELSPSLALFGTSRRYREAVLAAAETAADFAAIVEMGIPNDGPDEAAAFTSLPIEKRMMTVTPAGATVEQLKAEQPSTTYEMFNKQNTMEEARPLGMTHNIAAGDSGGMSYSGGQLDHQTYFVTIGVERQDCETETADRIFAVWYLQAVRVYGWNADYDSAPNHGWVWPKKPQNDPSKTAIARKTTLAFGGTTLSDIYAEDGDDFDDKIEQMANDFGVTVEEMKAKLLEACFPQQGGAPGMKDMPEKKEKPKGLPANANGHNRIADYISGAL